MLKKRGHAIEYTGFFAKHRFLIAAATLIGTIVGAGILGIPYVIAKAGFVYGLLMILFIGIAFFFLNLFAGELVLRTKEQHQLTGYAEKYLGKTGKKIMTASLFISIYGALTAYLIGEGATLYTIFNITSPVVFTIIFFLIGTVIVTRGLKATGKAEMFLIGLLFLIVALMGFFSYDEISASNFSHFNLTHFFLPYGVILFAFMALPAIPELQEELGNEKHKMKKVIMIGSIIPIVLYLLFSIIVVGLVGENDFDLLEPNQRIATIALSLFANPILGLFANILAVLAMFTSFLTLSTALIEMYQYDYNFSRTLALILTFSLPLVITLFKLTTFIAVLGITGAVAGGLDGILVMLMYWKAKKTGDRKPEYSMSYSRLIGIVLIIMFGIGILYQLWINFLQ